MKKASTLIVLAVLLAAGAARAESDKFLVTFESWAGEAERKSALKRAGALDYEMLEGLDAAVVEQNPMAVTSFADAASFDPVFGLIEKDVYVANWLVSAQAPSFYSTQLPAVSEILKAAKPEEAKPQAPGAGEVWKDSGEFPWGVRRVNAQAAWSRTKGAGIRVAVIDTGIDANHADLRGQVAGGFNAIDKKGSYFDDQGHGSHVAGTIAGKLDGNGVVGVAPEARLFAVKVLDANGGGRLSSIVKGILWAARNDIQVANMSLGSPLGSVFMRLACKYAASKGVVLIAAAGNNGGSVGYPAGFADVVAVSASDNRDQLAEFSSRGSDIEFIAPGVDVNSVDMGAKWIEHSGTSMASPHVAGLAALSMARGTPASGVRGELRRASRPIGLKPTEQGAGMIDAAVLVK